MHSAPSVAIVILNWNGKHFLEQFLPSVIASGYENLKIVVADNASTDDSIEFLTTFYPEITLLSSPVNEGFAQGYNTALAQVEADYYALLNSDVEATPGWIEPLVALMEKDRSIAVCQPKLLDYKDKKRFEYAGASGGWIDILGYPFARGRLFDISEVDTGQYDDTCPVFWATGAAFFIRAGVFHEMKGFDRYFFAHQEEIDLCWRCQLSGYKIFAEPSSVVYHFGGGALPMGDKRKVYLNFRNNLILLSKNSPILQSLWKIPVRFALDNITGLKSLFSKGGSTWIPILKAHFHFLKWLIRDRKKSVFPFKKSGKLAGVYKGLVIWKFFIQKKKAFSEIVKNKN